MLALCNAEVSKRNGRAAQSAAASCRPEDRDTAQRDALRKGAGSDNGSSPDVGNANGAEAPSRRHAEVSASAPRTAELQNIAGCEQERVNWSRSGEFSGLFLIGTCEGSETIGRWGIVSEPGRAGRLKSSKKRRTTSPSISPHRRGRGEGLVPKVVGEAENIMRRCF